MAGGGLTLSLAALASTLALGVLGGPLLARGCLPLPLAALASALGLLLGRGGLWRRCRRTIHGLAVVLRCALIHSHTLLCRAGTATTMSAAAAPPSATPWLLAVVGRDLALRAALSGLAALGSLGGHGLALAAALPLCPLAAGLLGLGLAAGARTGGMPRP